MTEPILRIKPSVPYALCYNILRIAVFLGVIYLALGITNRLAGFNVINFAVEIVGELKEAPDFAGSGFVMLIDVLSLFVREILTNLIIQFVVLLIILQIPNFNARIDIYADKVAYRTGAVFLKKKEIPFDEVTNAFSNKHFGLDFGEIGMEVFGEEKKVKVPYVLGVDKKFEKLKGKVLVKGKL